MNPAADFLRIADQFKLGRLVTEQPHPRSRALSRTASRSIPEALDLLFDVDRDVLATFHTWADGDAPLRIATTLAQRLRDGGKVFFTGCGATGRLSIQLAAIWRDFCQHQAAARDWEYRAFSVMAGGDFALIKSVEGFEDYTAFGKQQIEDLGVSAADTVFAITEGGETSFVIGTAWRAVEAGAKVHFVYNNPDHLLRETVERSREIIDEPRIEKINLTTGPMAITGSTRMQATSIQLCVMTTLLEMTARLLADDSPAAVAEIPDAFLRSLEEIHATLRSAPVREALARLVETEETIYRAHRRNNYFADRLAIDVLTDTTERSPTFCIPAFKKFDDPAASESWSFLFLPEPTTSEAWRSLLKRDLQPVEWSRETIRRLIGEADLDRQDRIMRNISRDEILRFRIGADGLPFREFRPGDGATAILTADELPALTDPSGFYRRQLESAHSHGATPSIVFLGTSDAIAELDTFLDSWTVPAQRILIPLPSDDSLLHGPRRAGAKMLLNALSTVTMVRLGRVLDNVMISVVPANLKLIDRSIRYLQMLTPLDYEQACLLLHDCLAYVAPRMKSGQTYPSPVALSLLVHRHQITFPEAETRLAESGL